MRRTGCYRDVKDMFAFLTGFLSSMKSRNKHNVVLVLQLVIQLPLRFRKHTHTHQKAQYSNICTSQRRNMCVYQYKYAYYSCAPFGVQSIANFSFHLHPVLSPVIESMDSNWSIQTVCACKYVFTYETPRTNLSCSCFHIIWNINWVRENVQSLVSQHSHRLTFTHTGTPALPDLNILISIV